MTSEINTTVPPPPPPPGQEPITGTLQRAGGALFSPEETFSEIARKPNVAGPLILLMVIALASSIVVVSKLDFETMIRDQMEESGRARTMSPGDMDRAVRIGSGFAKAIGYASPILAVGVWAIVAGVLLLAFRLLGGEGTYKQAFSATLYAWIPLTIKSLITTILILARGGVNPAEIDSVVRSNPAFLVDFKTQRVLYGLLSSLDLFTIWTLVLLIIGFAFVSKTSKARSAAIVISLWACAILVKLGFAAMGAAKARAAAAS